MSTILSIFKWLAYLVLGLVLAIALFLFGSRFADGPSGIAAGGAFTSGAHHVGPEPDWSFVKDRGEVEFQLLEPVRSRTTWIVEYEGRIYIPCGYMDTAWGRLWKQWPIEAEKDGRAVLRIDGMLYDRQLIRITEGEQLPVLVSEIARKYYPGAAQSSQQQQQQTIAAGLDRIADGALWIFELVPRG